MTVTRRGVIEGSLSSDRKKLLNTSAWRQLKEQIADINEIVNKVSDPYALQPDDFASLSSLIETAYNNVCGIESEIHPSND
jgi:hypothetical protein